MDEALVMLVLLVVPVAFVALQLHALLRWRGRYRMAAWLSLAGWALWAADLGLDLAADPTARNLFPLEIALGALASIAWLGFLALWQRLFPPAPAL